MLLELCLHMSKRFLPFPAFSSPSLYYFKLQKLKQKSRKLVNIYVLAEIFIDWFLLQNLLEKCRRRPRNQVHVLLSVLFAKKFLSFPFDSQQEPSSDIIFGTDESGHFVHH